MSTKIHLLDEVTRNQIAAGEVIERPASVVKELVENSLDAGATVISVELREGGTAYIEICDNGSGMDREDLVLSVERHATSKIRSVDDLFRVTSLGFRGEALASIASVSHTSIQSKTAESPTGALIKVEGGKVQAPVSLGCAVGTKIAVEELFYNVPPRKKYLKRSVTELGHCLDVVQDLALVHPEVQFTLTHNGRKVFATTGSGKAADGLVALYAKTVLQDVLPIDYRNPGRDAAAGASPVTPMSITGYASKPMAHRASRDRQKFFVNGRAVRSPMLAKAVEDAYRDTMPQGRYPLAVLFIKVPPDSVDVNVHPTKREVKFAAPGQVFDEVKRAVRSTVAQLDPASFSMAALANRKTFVMPQTPSQPDQLRQAYQNTQSLGMPHADRWTAPQNQIWYNELLQPLSAAQLPSDGATAGLSFTSTITSTSTLNWEPKFQLDKTFIVAEGPEGLILIDQHVAHERVLYDRFKKASDARAVAVQALLTPLVVELSQQELLALLDHAALLSEYGYEVEHFGEQSLLVRAVPSGLEKVNHAIALKEFAADIIGKGGSTGIEQLRDDILIMMSCKGAIKAGDPIDLNGSRQLIADLLKCDNPYTCPHGRPVVLQFSIDSLRGMFGR